MSFFETLSDMSKQHAENSGSYTFESPVTEPEPAPTVSLYNLLDHSAEQLDYLLTAIESQAMKVEGFKRINPLYTDMHKSLESWAALVQSAKKKSLDRDSLAWAEKTAKEIKEATL